MNQSDNVVTIILIAGFLVLVAMLQFGMIAEPGQPVVRLMDVLANYWLS